jgi:hemerythrin
MPKWSADLETGYRDLDDQHRKAFRLLDICINAVEAQMDRRCVVAILEETYDYFQRHMNYEEELMITHGYSELEEHRQEHQELLTEIRRVADDYAKSGHRTLVVIKLQTMLVLWAREHIKTLDKKMVEYFLKYEDPKPTAEPLK